MTGLEKMKSQILDEAKAAADAKIEEANVQAGEIISQAKADAEKIQKSISKKSEAEIAGYKDRIASSIDLQRRTRILAAKQEIIAEVLDQAYESLRTMETDEYFAMMLKLMEKYALAQDGEIFFSENDLKRMPADFAEKAEAIARSKNGSLKLSETGKNIENGFILVYGGIEENCTLQAVFDAKRDELADKVQHLLFA